MAINTHTTNTTNYQNQPYQNQPYQQPIVLPEKEKLLPGWLWLVLAVISLVVAYAAYDTYKRMDRESAMTATIAQTTMAPAASERTAAPVENTQAVAPSESDTSASNEGAMGTTASTNNSQSPAAQQ